MTMGLQPLSSRLVCLRPGIRGGSRSSQCTYSAAATASLPMPHGELKPVARPLQAHGSSPFGGW
jgi:hypothetical protein